MSTYLLLRNNKQTGPFTLDELKKMSLKAYDLVWVEGKSAAWRYPGEIAELTSFAPPVPEQPYDRFFKKVVPETSVIPALSEAKPAPGEPKPVPAFAVVAQQQTYPDQKKEYPEESQQQTLVNPKRENRKSVYINLPGSEKKLSGQATAPPVHEPIDLDWDEPRDPDSVKQPVAKGKSKRKALLAGAIVLFFIAGMLTGFYISNRRNIYSTDGNTPQSLTPVKSLKQASPEQHDLLSGADESKSKEINKSAVQAQPAAPIVARSKKRQMVGNPEKKDSAFAAVVPVSAHNAGDSAGKKQEADNKMNALATRIRAHPEEYLLISTGNYKTGLLGGISEAPVSVTNRSGVTMDLVVVEINYILHNKKIFKTENLSFHNLSPGMTVTEAAPKSARGIKITYRLTVANSGQIGMEYSNFK
ncbi:MAG: DUF4339 domain-containing protein [Chitinophagales bacterium]